MIRVFQRNPGFYLPYLIFLLSGFILILLYDKLDIFLWVNTHHTTWQDVLFYYSTTIGNGLTFIVISLLLSLISFRHTIAGLATWIVQGALAQVFKKLVFPDELRPIKFFDESTILHFVEGVKVYGHFSFPSGHSTTAFCMLCFLSLLYRNQFTGIIFLLLAVLAAYSRIYLVQHFFVDVYAGSILGVFTASLGYWVFFQSRWSQRWKWMDRKLYNS